MTAYKIIVLDPEYLWLAENLATKRYKTNRENQIRDYRNTTKLTEHEKETISILGEMAFSVLINVHFPLSQDPSRAGSHDLVLPNGKFCDVKTRTDSTWTDLQVNQEAIQKHRFDYYILMTRAGELIYEYRGWATGISVLQAEPITKTGIPYYQIPEHKLFSDLEHLCKF